MIYSGLSTYEATMLIMAFCGLVLDLISTIIIILTYKKNTEK